MMHVFASTFAVKTTQNGTLGYSDEINEQAEVFLFDKIYGLIWIHNALHWIRETFQLDAKLKHFECTFPNCWSYSIKWMHQLQQDHKKFNNFTTDTSRT